MTDAGSATAQPHLRLRDLLDWADVPLKDAGRSVGLDEPVRWAQATEMLDPGPFLRGGEVVLTTGMSLGSPAACR